MRQKEHKLIIELSQTGHWWIFFFAQLVKKYLQLLNSCHGNCFTFIGRKLIFSYCKSEPFVWGCDSLAICFSEGRQLFWGQKKLFWVIWWQLWFGGRLQFTTLAAGFACLCSFAEQLYLPLTKLLTSVICDCTYCTSDLLYFSYTIKNFFSVQPFIGKWDDLKTKPKRYIKNNTNGIINRT